MTLSTYIFIAGRFGGHIDESVRSFWETLYSQKLKFLREVKIVALKQKFVLDTIRESKEAIKTIVKKQAEEDESDSKDEESDMDEEEPDEENEETKMEYEETGKEEEDMDLDGEHHEETDMGNTETENGGGMEQDYEDDNNPDEKRKLTDEEENNKMAEMRNLYKPTKEHPKAATFGHKARQLAKLCNDVALENKCPDIENKIFFSTESLCPPQKKNKNPLAVTIANYGKLDSIIISTVVLQEQDLFEILVHELGHAAVELFNKNEQYDHGPKWRAVTARILRNLSQHMSYIAHILGDMPRIREEKILKAKYRLT